MRIVRTLLLRIDACPGSPLLEGSEVAKRSPDGACVHDPAVDELRKKVARRFKLKQDGAWARAPVDATLTALLDHVAELAAAGTARFGEGFLTERIEFADEFEWYHLAPRDGFTPKLRKEGATQLLGEYGSVYASGAFRRAAEAAKLRGLEFGVLYAPPTRDDPRAWYTCFASALLGRGLDHPWAPPYTPKTTEGETRLGSIHADNRTVNSEHLDPLVRRLAEMFPAGELRLGSFDRQLAESLPDADVACKPIIDGGGRWYGAGVYVSHRAARALLDAGVLRTADLEPIEVVRGKDLDVAALDRTFGPLPQSLRDQVAARKSVPIVDEPAAPRAKADVRLPLREVIAAAKQKVEVFEPFNDREVDAAAAAAGVKLPLVWRLVLTQLGRAQLNDLLPYALTDWAGFQPDHEALAETDETLPRRMLAVGSAFDGDWYSLDLERVTPEGDCPLLKFDHEVNRCVDRWPTVTDYLRDALELSA